MRLETLVLVLTEWVERAKCHDYPVTMFIFDNEERDTIRRIREAKAVCEDCPVQAECLEEGIRSGSVGIWGGLTLKERQKIPRVEKIIPIPATRLEYRDGKYRQVKDPT